MDQHTFETILKAGGALLREGWYTRLMSARTVSGGA